MAVLSKAAQFYVVDSDPRIIDAWNSNDLPFSEPQLDELLFEVNRGLPELEHRAFLDEPEHTTGDLDLDLEAQLPSVRRLPNITFSTDVHSGIRAADAVFLCTETSHGQDIAEDTSGVDMSMMDGIIQAIAQVSTGHKIIVHKGSAPYGTAKRIQSLLEESASPTASFDIFSNPDFLLPGSELEGLLYPQRVIIGHAPKTIFPESVIALKRLYMSWIPEQRIIAMDAWSSELGKIAANVLLTQQVTSLCSLSIICQHTDAQLDHVTGSLGIDSPTGIGDWDGRLYSDVQCLVYLAKELGLHEVAEYWKSVLQIRDFYIRHIANRLIQKLPEVGTRRVALIGSGRPGMTNTVQQVAQELSQRGIGVNIFRAVDSSVQLTGNCPSEDTAPGKIAFTETLEEACRGCSIVCQLCGSATDKLHEGWQHIEPTMEPPRLFMNQSGTVEEKRMRRDGFQVSGLNEDSVVRACNGLSPQEEGCTSLLG
ncbi:UDP-glucose dehydrogenase Ugd1 [Aspergillus terreus]|uniref:UDP-glucose dehydrogenase Ugd1 n=1 Tax=Aspergillus terreus TaxID=33178 RepID=A0A5M3Z9J5_ASPTE|nr:hypothetical protein ATETN484_0012011000 [Aspergillus terreus]GFF19358.1 UDP-glucose dehydrogenase Ugd1 [Aspergillus terreus]